MDTSVHVGGFEEADTMMHRDPSHRQSQAAAVVLLFATLSWAWAGRAEARGTQGPTVLGSVSSKIYHELDCNSARRLSTENRFRFPSPGAAEASGFRACRSCKPNESILMASILVGLTPSPSQEPSSFTKDVAPVLVANCLRCHNEQQRRGDLDMSTFRKLIAGSDAGPIIAPKAPEESELILRVRGESTPKMPPGNTDLAEETIAALERWIAEGALLDAGADPSASLADVAVTPESIRNAELAGLTAEQRHERLKTTALERWALASADSEPTMTAGTRVLVFGTLPEKRASEVAETLDKVIPSLDGLLGRPGQPALNGPMEFSVYVLNDRNQYAEFVRSVASQELGPDERARADLSGEAPYVVALDPLGGNVEPEDDGPTADRSLESLLVEQLADSAVSKTSAEAPRWLGLGLGAYMAAQLDPRGAYPNQLRAGALRAVQLGWVTKTGEALGDQLDADETRALCLSLFEWLSTTNRQAFGPFVRGMLGGVNKLDEGVEYLFGATRDEFQAAWGQWVASRYGGRRR